MIHSTVRRKALTILLASSFALPLSIIGDADVAQANLQFCNHTAGDSYVVEGHRTEHTGLTVHGTMTVKKGTCSVIVPGRLAPHSYYLRVIQDNGSYGGADRLCIADMADFTITGEDRPGFKCRGNIVAASTSQLAHVLPGFKNKPLHLASFMTIPSYGHATMIVTQRNNGTVHYVLK